MEHANEHLIEVAIDGNDLLAQMKINGGRRDHIIQKHIRFHFFHIRFRITFHFIFHSHILMLGDINNRQLGQNLR